MSKDHKPVTVAKIESRPVVDASHAPFLFFDSVPTSGTMEGVVLVTLAAMAQLPGPNASEIISVPAVVAYLRTNRIGAKSLRDALDGALLMGEATQGGEN